MVSLGVFFSRSIGPDVFGTSLFALDLGLPPLRLVLLLDDDMLGLSVLLSDCFDAIPPAELAESSEVLCEVPALVGGEVVFFSGDEVLLDGVATVDVAEVEILLVFLLGCGGGAWLTVFDDAACFADVADAVVGVLLLGSDSPLDDRRL